MLSKRSRLEIQLHEARNLKESIERKEDTKVSGMDSVAQSDFLSVDDAIQIDRNDHISVDNVSDEEIDVETTLNAKVEDVAIESASDHSDADADCSKADDD